MKVMIIGGGGREHAMAWQIAQFKTIEKVWVAPGNAGTAQEAKIENVAIAVTDIKALIAHAQQHRIDLTLIGPEAPLAAGIVDQFTEQNLNCFGPTQQAAQLEASKAYSKDFMQQHGIPTARYQNFTDYTQAAEYIKQQPLPIVVKAAGLAAGKGVVIAHTHQQALNTAEEMLSGNAFDGAGREIVVEEFLQGEEASFIAVCDGQQALALASSQDHKARDDGDQGPNTGGMGAYSPAPCVTPEIHDRIMTEVIQPTLQGMVEQGTPYRGFLYAGLMLLPNGELRVLEFNCRLGDPETQPLMMRLKTNLAEICLAAIQGTLQQSVLQWEARTALGVVMAAGGYPQQYQTGDVITGLDTINDFNVKVFHAGTKLDEAQQIQTNGGRVLCVTALGETLSSAQAAAYRTVKQIHWPHAFFRTDIGAKVF